MKVGDLSEIGLDRYSRNARLKPALLVLLPTFITTAVWFPKVWTLLGGLVAMISACGFTFLLAEVARFKGRQVQAEMVRENGGKFTTILLRHRDSTLNGATKKNYHSFLQKSANIELPSKEQEEADPVDADDRYCGVVDWLLEATRGENSLVFKENVSYGFRRNLLGLKLSALLLIVPCLLINAFFACRSFGVDQARFVTGCIVSLALVAIGAIWVLIVQRSFVEDAGRTYASRLLAQCDVLRKRTATRKSPSKSPQSPDTPQIPT
jgi:hypothetical protein